MAYTDKKVLEVLVHELGTVPERCTGYREELAHLLDDVLNLERENTIVKIDMQKEVKDRVNTVGMFLHNMRSAEIQVPGEEQ